MTQFLSVVWSFLAVSLFTLLPLPIAEAGFDRAADMSIRVDVEPDFRPPGTLGAIRITLENLGPDEVSASAGVVVTGTPVIFSLPTSPGCELVIDRISPIPGNPPIFIYVYFQRERIAAGSTFVCELEFFVDPELQEQVETIWEVRVSASSTELNPSNNTQTVIFGVAPLAVPAFSTLGLGIALLLFAVFFAQNLRRRQ